MLSATFLSQKVQVYQPIKTIARQVLCLDYTSARNLYRGCRAVPLQTFITRHANRILSIDLALSTTFVQLAPETTKFDKKLRKIRAIWPFKVIQCHRFLYQSIAHIRLPISD